MDKSSLEFKKADGSPIKFNFELPNGLPYKEILSPDFIFGKSKENDEFGIHVNFSTNELKEIGGFNIVDVQVYENNLWIIFEKHYVVLYNLNDKIMNELNKNNLFFCFFDENKKFLNGFKLNNE